MKKNKALRAAACVAVAAMLSTCMVAGTFAKYTANGTGKDTARVAKFGVELTTGDGMFAKSYDNTVASSTDDKVVAPGTKGELKATTLTGTPEVSVKVTNEATVTLANWTSDANGAFYCPIKVKVGGTTIDGTTQTSADAFQTAIKNAIDSKTDTYNAGTALDGKSATPDVSWEWAFDGDDTKDTYLGNAAGAGTIDITIKTTVTQVD